MWTRTVCAGSSSSSTAFTCGRASLAGFAGRPSGGFWSPEEVRTTARNASVESRSIVFCISNLLSIPEYRRSHSFRLRKWFKTNTSLNGLRIAIWKVPVMYRLLENIPVSPKHSRIRQEPPPTKRPSKRGNRPEKPAEGAADITAVLIRLGRPVTSAGQRNATLIRVAFLVSGAFWTNGASEQGR